MGSYRNERDGVEGKVLEPKLEVDGLMRLCKILELRKQCLGGLVNTVLPF